MCTPHRRASEGRVGAHHGKEHRCAHLHRNRTVKNAPGSTHSTLSSKDAKKRKQLQKYKKLLHLFCKGVPFNFLHILLLPFPHTDNWKWHKVQYPKVFLLTALPTWDSFRLGGGGGCVVFANPVCVWVVFMRLLKIMGTYLNCWAKENSLF